MTTDTTTEERADSQARAQVASIVEMVTALDVDYDRLEELRDKRSAGHWVAGWNMPGYMPDNESAAFDTCDEARDYIADQIENDADDIEAGADDLPDEEKPDSLAVALTVKEDAQTLRGIIGDDEKSDEEFGATLAGCHYWITHQPNVLADADEATELQELEDAAGDCESEDDAQQRIQEDALSVEVRSGWQTLGEELTADEFRIVLCTGGPHVELQGDLDQHGEPDRVRVIYKDWGTSGELFDFDRDAVLRYCRHYCFSM